MLMTIIKFFATIGGLLGGAAITVKLVFGVWIPRGTPMWLVFWVPIVGVLLAILMFPATLRSMDESFDRGVELYEKVSDKWKGRSKPRVTPYATVCTPEGGWKSKHDLLEGLRSAGVQLTQHAHDFILFADIDSRKSVRCYELVMKTDGKSASSRSLESGMRVCPAEVVPLYLMSKIKNSGLLVASFGRSSGRSVFDSNSGQLAHITFLGEQGSALVILTGDSYSEKSPHFFCSG